MKQRAALARALAPNPRVLLMDEPFAALDALTREQLYGDLQRIWKERKKTIVFVTHNVREAACLGERVLLFSPHPGRIQEEFIVDLPRPRDINSVDLAGYATKIIRSLRKFSEEQREDGRSKDFFPLHFFSLCFSSCGKRFFAQRSGRRYCCRLHSRWQIISRVRLRMEHLATRQ